MNMDILKWEEIYHKYEKCKKYMEKIYKKWKEFHIYLSIIANTVLYGETIHV